MQQLVLKLTATIGFLSVFCFGSANAQMHFVPDTFQLGGVTIESSRQKTFSAGSKVLEADTLMLQLSEGSAVTDILLRMTPLNFKTFGSSGTAATISLRGAGGSRTQVAWNGMPLNSLTLGDVNMSVLSTTAFDNVQIDFSAPATLYGSNAFGGVINLTNSSPFEPKLNITFAQQVGELHTQQTSASVQIANHTFSSKTSLWYFGSDNNFDYYDEQAERNLKRFNAQHNSFGLMHNTRFRLGTNQVLSTGIWIQQNETGIPPVNGTNPRMQFSSQNDETARVFVKWDWYNNKLLITARSFVFYDYMLYKQKLTPEDENYSINSDIITLQNETEFTGRYTFSNKITADAGASFRRNTADGKNFTSKPSDNQAALFSAIRYKNAKLSGVLSVRKEFSTLFVPPVRFGLGINFTPLQDLNVRASVNQKYRMPTFNDKYWPVLGDININPETGITCDCGIDYSRKAKFLSYGISTSLYRLNMDQMIAWTPQGGVWRPTNYTNVISKGIENKVWLGYKRHNFYVRNDVAFDVNSARKKSGEYQLPYTPKYRASNVLTMVIGNFSGTLSGNYLSRRHFDDSYLTLNEIISANSSVQYRFGFKTINLYITAAIKNINNNTEPVIKDYPTVGRQFMGGIKLKFNT